MEDPKEPTSAKNAIDGAEEASPVWAEKPDNDSAAVTQQDAYDASSTEEWKESHALYLEDAKERIGRARTVLLMWIAALLTTWLSGIEQSRRDVEEFVASQSTKSRSVNQSNEPERRTELLMPPKRSIPKAEVTGKGQEEAGPEKPPGAKAAEDTITVPSSQERSNAHKPQETNEHKELRQKATQAVNLELFGAKVPIPLLVAVPVWLALLCCMLLKLLSDRWWVFHSLSRALRIERKHLMTRSRERIANAPWWLAPLPRVSDSRHVSRDDLMVALDWRSRSRRRLLLPGLSLLVVGSVVSEVLYVNKRLIEQVPQLAFAVGRDFPIWQCHLANWAPPILVVVCIALLAKWCSAFEMPDFFLARPHRVSYPGATL